MNSSWVFYAIIYFSDTTMPANALDCHHISSKRVIQSVERMKKNVQLNSNQVSQPITMPAPGIT